MLRDETGSVCLSFHFLTRRLICCGVHSFCRYASLVSHEASYDTPRRGTDHSFEVFLYNINVRILPKMAIRVLESSPLSVTAYAFSSLFLLKLSLENVYLSDQMCANLT